MRYWSREIIRSTFYDDLEDYVTSDLATFSPSANQFPLPDYPIGVDWSLTFKNWNFYLFGVNSNDKAKNVALALLEIPEGEVALYRSRRTRRYGSAWEKGAHLPHPQRRQAVSRLGRLPKVKHPGYSPACRGHRIVNSDNYTRRAEEASAAFHPQPYPAYKPSGVDWLGDVPAHWEVRRLRTVGEGDNRSDLLPSRSG